MKDDVLNVTLEPFTVEQRNAIIQAKIILLQVSQEDTGTGGYLEEAAGNALQALEEAFDLGYT